MRDRPVGTVFREGDEVVLAEGTYQGTQGVFLRLREDVNWADVTGRDGSVRSHPVAWLDHSTATNGPPEVEAWEGEGGAASKAGSAGAGQ
ncbi:MAG TPA: hypothetical protein VNY05_18085 [Candidatus Acidoferrales bacterium]|jgi:hypothetical protein|nr:hypothetical protein [Candidatus Acidoferrales bacterium]